MPPHPTLSGTKLDAGGGSYNGIDSSNLLLEPEENTAIELGTKWQFGNLTATAAAVPDHQGQRP